MNWFSKQKDKFQKKQEEREERQFTKLKAKSEAAKKAEVRLREKKKMLAQIQKTNNLKNKVSDMDKKRKNAKFDKLKKNLSKFGNDANKKQIKHKRSDFF